MVQISQFAGFEDIFKRDPGDVAILKNIKGGIQDIQTQDLAAELATPGISEEARQEALIRLQTINPQAAQSIEGTLTRGDNRALAQQQKQADDAFKLATFFDSIKDPQLQSVAIRKEARRVQATGDTDGAQQLLDLANQTPAERRIAITKQIITAGDTKTVTKFAQDQVAQRQAEDINIARTLRSTPFENQPALLLQLEKQALSEGRQDRVDLFRKLQRITPEARNAALDAVIAKAGPVKPVSVAREASLVDPTTGEVRFQAPIAGATGIAKPSPKDFTGTSLDKFNKSGNFSDLELTPEAKASLNRTGTFVTGDSTLFKDQNGNTFIATPVTNKELGTTSINVNPIEAPGGVAGTVASRALGETPAEKEAREIRTAGGKTREELLAEIKLKPDLTRIQKQQQRDFVNMDSALDAAENIPLLRQNLKLLSRIDTGGIDAIVLATARKLGVESADQAELTFNLRTNVLKQLKPTFGAQFTEREGKLLAEIQAAETKSTKGNIRLVKRAIEIYDRAIQRGLRSAKRQGDTAQKEEIEAAMALFEDLDITDPGTPAPTATSGSAAPAPSGKLSPDQKQRLELLRNKQR